MNYCSTKVTKYHCLDLFNPISEKFFRSGVPRDSHCDPSTYFFISVLYTLDFITRSQDLDPVTIVGYPFRVDVSLV